FLKTRITTKIPFPSHLLPLLNLSFLQKVKFWESKWSSSILYLILDVESSNSNLVYSVSRQRSNCGFGSVADNLVFHLELRSSTVARNAKIYLTRYLKTKAILMELTLEQHSLICYL
ncbi:unnamed protein product, partial [Brassica rapa]